MMQDEQQPKEALRIFGDHRILYQTARYGPALDHIILTTSFGFMNPNAIAYNAIAYDADPRRKTSTSGRRFPQIPDPGWGCERHR
jgi:hypothetical protein